MSKKKLRYAVLKEVEKGINHRDLTHEDFSVTEKELYDCMEYLVDEKYVKGFIYADAKYQFSLGSPRLTEKGENYLEENSALAKTYKGLKEIRDWLKL
jgi:hypothetical protein